MLVDASKHGVFKYSAYNLVICKPLEATLGSNLTPKPFSVSFLRTHYQGYCDVLQDRPNLLLAMPHYTEFLQICFSDVPKEPGVPDIVKFEAGSAQLRWSAPRNDGGSPITNYKVEMRTAGAYRWELVNPTEIIPGTSYTVRGLLEETDYEFRVSAENAAGVGRPSQSSRSAKYGKFII